MQGKPDEKMQMIGAAVILQAEQQRKDIVEKASELQDQEIDAFKNQMIEAMIEAVRLRTQHARQSAVERKALAEREAYHALIRRREALTASVFDAVRARIEAYTASKAYHDQLLEGIGAYKEHYDHAASTIQLRKNDMGLAAKIEKRLPGCRVEAVKSIRIGGFRLRNPAAGVLVDKTLDLVLEDLRPQFLQSCGMKIV